MWTVGICGRGCTLRGMAGGSDVCCVNAECPDVAVTVVGTRGDTATVESWLSVAASDGGGCSEACTVEAGDRLLVVRAASDAASWLMLAGGVAYCRN